ncbi:LOW QUALITY PROTEIN: uncharacterized protein LOC108326796 [Vigna angularis]|nr:LOW QUALITY PROTEIN: uncharacterized protein LOC108326796 [Vigna angularis]
MTFCALSSTSISPSFPASHRHQSKFSSLRFSSSRSQPLATQLRKTIAATRFTTFCSLDAANAPKQDTPIEFSTQLVFSYDTWILSRSIFLHACFLDFAVVIGYIPSVCLLCLLYFLNLFSLLFLVGVSFRFPFLLVDRVIEYNPGVSAVAIKNVTINDNFFPGHFPERPIMPGVLMVEAMAQVGGLVMLQPEVGGSRQNFFFVGIDKVRFRMPVIAGDTLVMRMTLTKLQKRFGIAKMEGKAYVGGEVVCKGEFFMATGSE